MCRSEAMRLHALKPKFDAAGCDLVCLLKENIPEQVDQFLAGGGVAGEFWSKETPLFLDDDMTFFRALGVVLIGALGLNSAVVWTAGLLVMSLGLALLGFGIYNAKQARNDAS